MFWGREVVIICSSNNSILHCSKILFQDFLNTYYKNTKQKNNFVFEENVLFFTVLNLLTFYLIKPINFNEKIENFKLCL